MISVKDITISQSRSRPERDRTGALKGLSHPPVSVSVKVEFDYDVSWKGEVALVKALFEALDRFREEATRPRRSKKEYEE